MAGRSSISDLESIGGSACDRSFLAGGGEMGERIRAFDWAGTPLGPVSVWPQSLRTAASIVLNSLYPMFVFWGPQRITLYNDAYCPMLGAGKHPWALGRSGELVWPEIWSTIGPMVEEVIEAGRATWSENLPLFIRRSSDLEETYFTFSYSPIRDESGGVGGLFCACTETTTRVLSERRLRTLRDLAAQTGSAHSAEAACHLAAQTFEANPADLPFALIYLLDGEGQRALRTGAAGSKRVVAALPGAVVLGEQSGWGAAMREAIQTGRAVVVTDLLAAAGPLQAGLWPEAIREALVLPFTGSGQERPAGLLVAGIGARRVLDEEYRGFLDLAAAQVGAAVANARAYENERQRAEELAQLDRAKIAFFSNVSHEFRTPLTLMLGPVEELLAAGLPEAMHSKAETLHRNGLRLLKLVNALLDYARVESGRSEAHFVPTDLAACTADLAGTFRTTIEKAGLALEVVCPPVGEPVYIDRSLWELIVLNLLSNAFKFTFTGRISVRLSREAKTVLLAVEDTGTGIPAHELPQLFERFHRVEGAVGRSFEGSGIGLALVAELVKLHGGSVHVESEVAKGSSFQVRIPLGTAHLQPDQVGSAPEILVATAKPIAFVEEVRSWLPTATVDEQGGAGEQTVLLVDDNSDMRAYLCRLLSPRYRTLAVANGLEALEAIRRAPPDLVLTDAMMPRLDGSGLIEALRADQATRDLPVIILSARAGEEAKVEGLVAGADDYLVKPFSARELLVRIEAVLKMAHLRREVAQRERKLRTEAQLARQELDSVLSRIGDLFLALDREWRYSYVNERVCELVGLPREQLLGQCIQELFAEAGGLPFDRYLRAALDKQQPVHFEYFSERWQRWFENRVYPSEDGVSVFITDITERKRAEERLRLWNSALEQAVVERTDQLRELNDELEGEIIERKRTGQQMLLSLQEKELLLREIHHRVKNNLQVIASLLKLQAHQLANAKLTTAFAECQQRIQAMALIHQHLYQSANLARIEFRAYLKELVGSLFRAYNVCPQRIRLIQEIAEVPVSIDIAVPLGLILSELVSNALKYAFVGRRQGQLRLQFRRLRDNFCQLVLDDDGIGLPDDLDWRSTQSLGLHLVRLLVEQLDGNLTVHQETGTCFEITFTLPDDRGKIR
ncbi:ATP-binding protein [Gloeobacter kilaueensis]|uniref:histidine kinase n=1 Tax=Gloeobacter kilaueensis (strain ATCC BAA-2537 / CCAP 1431/1 / ULC 316 / JS1) TaxID=1183438 RepID=U5QLF2_GLOK1|nr:ATP-binding protein [Gloeobacter kilaueensis]AGY58500.1 multi-sensor signal transduction histidine kinase [Gloeobacter kilaueensis JS1]